MALEAPSPPSASLEKRKSPLDSSLPCEFNGCIFFPVRCGNHHRSNDKNLTTRVQLLDPQQFRRQNKNIVEAMDPKRGIQ